MKARAATPRNLRARRRKDNAIWEQTLRRLEASQAELARKLSDLQRAETQQRLQFGVQAGRSDGNRKLEARRNAPDPRADRRVRLRTPVGKPTATITHQSGARARKKTVPRHRRVAC